MQRNLINWLALLRTVDIGPIKFKNFLQTDPFLETLPQVARDTLHNSKHLIKQDLAWAEQNNCHVVLLCDNDYPKLLRTIHAPPPVLFIKGNRHLLDKPQIAIVGSRCASTVGEQTAFKFAAEFASYHIAVTSGLATGIDAASHKGALSKGATIAVLAHGLDLIYPREHYKLANKIIDNGALISEFPIGTQPIPGNFPRRNRIISGLALGVVVIEASIKSGSLITVNHALEQGREVFAVPGSIYNNNVKGCHQLIKQGAKLVENVSEVIEELGFTNATINLQNKSDKLNYIRPKENLDGLQTKILDSISYETTTTDLIINRSGLIPSTVNAVLVNLELNGYIVSVPGGYTRLLLEI